MKKALLILISALISFSNAWAFSNVTTIHIVQQTDNITATITTETTDQQLTDLKQYFEENGILLTVTDIARNTTNQITGLNLTIKKENQQSSFNSNSNRPIADLELGYKEGNVFVGNLETSLSLNGNMSLQNLINGFNKNEGVSLDSLLSQHQFSFSFGSEDIKELLNNSSFDFDQIQDQFFGQFFNTDPKKNNPKSVNPTKNNSNTIPKYNFFNNKNIQKLIIIDGNESNFETLDALAKADKLKEVDNLKPSTAMSIYGEKAKDGAIIATSR